MDSSTARQQTRAQEQEREAQRQQAEAVRDLREILKRRNLAICVGSGVTLYSIGAAEEHRVTWTGLITNGFDYLERELPNFYQQQVDAFRRARELLDDHTATPEDLIDAASKLKRFFQAHPVKLADWLSLQFKSLPRYVDSPAILESLKKLHRNGALLMTTNYDGLIEEYCGLSPLDSSDKDKLMEFNRRLCHGVFHPHGYWKNPKHIVLDAIDYYKVQHDDGVQETLRNIFTGRTILFVGCGGGLADPNFGELLKWLGEKEKNIGSSHYILLRRGERNPVPQLPLKQVRCEDYDAIGPWLENLLDPSPPIPVVEAGKIYRLSITDEKTLTVVNLNGDVKLRPRNDEDSQKWKVETSDNGSFGFRNMYNRGLLGVNAGGWVAAGMYRLGEWERFFLVPAQHGHRFIVAQWGPLQSLPLMQLGDYLEVPRFFGIGGSGGSHATITITYLSG